MLRSVKSLSSRLVDFSNILLLGSDLTLNYRVIVEKYPFPNGVVGGSIPVVKSSLYLTEESS